MRRRRSPVCYLVGTPKGRLTKLEKSPIGLRGKPCAKASMSSFYQSRRKRCVLARSRSGIHRERAIRRQKLKWRWGRLLRTNLTGRDPAQFYIQLTEIEAAFKNLKDDLELRSIYHQRIERVEAHIFVAFMAYCLHVTLRASLRPRAAGLTPRAVLDKFVAIQMLDIHFPTTNARTLILSRYTELNPDQKLLVRPFKLELPAAPPRITAADQAVRPHPRRVVKTFGPHTAFCRLCGPRFALSGESRASGQSAAQNAVTPQRLWTGATRRNCRTASCRLFAFLASRE